MFLNLQEPEFQDIYETTPAYFEHEGKPEKNLVIRIREKDAPGRLWLNLAFKDKAHAKQFLDRCQAALAAGVQEYNPKKG